MGKVFAITSGKGGVGKSTVSVGLAYAFCKAGKKVLLVDMDEGFRCLDLMLGVDSSAVFDLSDILMGREIEDAIYTCDNPRGLHLIPAPAKTDTVDAYSFAKFAAEVEAVFDIVIFDFPAGINLSHYSALPHNTLFLTVAVPDPVSIRDAAVISRQLSEISLPARLIINRFIYKQSRKYGFKNIDSMIDSSALRLIGIVPESYDLSLISVKHKLENKSRALAAFKRIAARLSGENLLLPKLKKI